jgi:hypothetical protein
MFNLLNAYANWQRKNKKSDISKIKINRNGSYFLPNGNLFSDKEKVSEYIKAINKIFKK